MATLKKGWVGPLFQSKEGKRPWVCDYTHPLSWQKDAEEDRRRRRQQERAGAALS